MLITFLGPNVFSKQREMRKRLDGVRYISVYGEEGLRPWFENLGQADLFGDSAVLVGHSLCEDLSKEDQLRLAEYLTAQNINQSDQTAYFIVNDDKKFADSPLNTVLRQGTIVAFPHPNQAKLTLWVQLEAERLGLKLDKQAIPSLLQRFGDDQFAIQTELERLALLGDQKITKEVILEVPLLGVELDNFALIQSWVDKNKGAAIDQLAMLRRQGVADQVIIGSLAWKIATLLQQSIGSGKSGKRSQQELEQAMESLYELDLRAKQGKAEYEIGLELWLVETMG